MNSKKPLLKRLTERIPLAIKTKVFERDGNRCIKCRTQKWLEIHHITPVYSGGTNDENNLVTLCSLCHHFAPDGPLKFIKYMSDPNRPPFDLAIDIAEKAFISAIQLEEADYTIARSNPVAFWKARYGKEVRNALRWMYENE